MKVLSVPHLEQLGGGESGIHTVIRAYFRHGADYGIEWVSREADTFDVLAIHAGTAGKYPANSPIVAHTHGLYWTADYNMGRWAHKSNRTVVNSIVHARQITVPSEWVGEVFKRDMRLTPHVVPHGIDWDNWQHNYERGNYVIGYAKNRAGLDVCDPSFLSGMALNFPDLPFVCTFAPPDHPKNVIPLGLLEHEEMRELVQKSRVYISTTKETWGIGMLEAMASGVPVLAFDEGGASELVEHGVTGYLARPGRYDDLSDGLSYCLKYADILGDNAREAAKKYDRWEAAMIKVSQIYRLATEVEQPHVAIVIPVYNKPVEQVARAINSARNQTATNVKEIVVVNDGSTNGEDYEQLCRDLRVKYVYQDNKGVAEARNTGIDSTISKYVVCLDADDWIAESFVEVCVRELELDNSLGIAFTGLYSHEPNGKEGLSPWPDGWDFDAQIKGQNQIPTCCMIRRSALERSGGYHKRYCPEGAGQEDANLWLRIPAMGMKAAMVTREGLFHYSWKTGQVSGNPNHKETDWRGLLPWTRDAKHPFASYAKPKNNLAHPVRQYDQPSVSIIIPVGAGHHNMVFNALDSIESQTYRGWEAIVVWDSEPPVSAINKMSNAYPYVKHASTGGAGKGAGAARNIGAEMARGNFLLFLDADDNLHPHAVEHMIAKFAQTGSAVYTDYWGKAIIDNVDRLAPELRQRILSRDDESMETVIEYKAGDYDRDRALNQPGNPPYIWNLITTLIPKLWWQELGGFDENMVSWEDVDFWWRMAWSGKPFVRLAEPLVVYRFHTGVRREIGRENKELLRDYMLTKRAEFFAEERA